MQRSGTDLFGQDTSLREQIECVARELAFRRRVYPRQIQNKRMTQEKADYEIETMQKVLETLRGMANHNRGVSVNET